ncbi:MAG: hypothetical protein IPK13_17120 [Deltaproteobacteria bacterium]|nr:hypothetical protein [Deltaproteobacteria bacterium]
MGSSIGHLKRYFLGTEERSVVSPEPEGASSKVEDLASLSARYPDVGQIAEAFDRAIARMNQDGIRSEPPVANSMKSYYGEMYSDIFEGGKNRPTAERCYGQSEEVLVDLARTGLGGRFDRMSRRFFKSARDPEPEWKFEMAEEPGHYFVRATPADSTKPVLELDALYNEIRILPRDR